MALHKPFTYQAAKDTLTGEPLPDRWEIVGEHERIVALCYTQVDAKFLTVSLNYFDPLLSVLRLCRGRYEVDTRPHFGPGYDELVELQADIEADLQRQD